ncbi:MAG TPA: alpha-amylase family protein [Devosiaceae bacterium]|jgi:maltose alpha-D-glucosyltransferase/alpha-amylase|nr:alpha-amylase family protein [Devosiaceae bacterium]
MLDLWYKNSIIYSLNVGTFADANGDGVGDFAGLRSRLDHLNWLGVNCIWLQPFYPSPRLDYGYDVTDYYDINDRNGTFGEFVEFARQARERGIRILIDLPANHTSDQHPWFQQARSDPQSRYRDYYLWSESEPAATDEGMAFPGFQERVWTYDETAEAWYFHRFYAHQPDLSIMNPMVREEIKRVMGFWLELGVAGFRMDATHFLLDEDRPDGTSIRHYEFLGEFREFLSWRKGDAVMLAEANVEPDELAEFIGPTRMQMAFAFLMNQHLFLSLARGTAKPLAKMLSEQTDLGQTGQYAQFLRNHDELDLGRLSEEERQDVFRAFAPEPEMQIFGRGIRRRLAPMLGGNRRRMELANSLMFSMPGSPVIYYGDEIGMGDDLSLEERWPVRTVMQWSGEPGGGFSSAPPAEFVHPVVEEGEFGAGVVNVEEQRRDPNSLLNWTRQLCDVRKSCPEVGWGRPELVGVDNDAVLAHRYRWRGSHVLLVHNLHDRACRVSLDLMPEERGELVDLFGNQVYPPESGNSRTIELDGYGYRWFRARC